MRAIDLNADLGEGGPADAELFAVVSSANIACGLHAGDPATMARSLALCRQHGVVAGAHPGFADRTQFGRREHEATAEQVFALVLYQVAALHALAGAAAVPIRHVKAHGALYHLVARTRPTAEAFVSAVLRVGKLAVVGPPGSTLQQEAQRAGLRFVAEAFLDRAYDDEGKLVPRGEPGAVISHASGAAAARALELALHQRVKTDSGRWMPVAAESLCVHGDTPGAIEAAREARRALEDAGVVVSAPKHV